MIKKLLSYSISMLTKVIIIIILYIEIKIFVKNSNGIIEMLFIIQSINNIILDFESWKY